MKRRFILLIWRKMLIPSGFANAILVLCCNQLDHMQLESSVAVGCCRLPPNIGTISSDVDDNARPRHPIAFISMNTSADPSQRNNHIAPQHNRYY